MVGTALTVDIVSPPVHTESGGLLFNPYGFTAEIGDGIARVGYGPNRPEGADILKAHVARAGRTISVTVPLSELDRPPPKLDDRPPFPRRTFSFRASVVTPLSGAGGHFGDEVPRRGEPNAGYVDGRLCPRPCAALRDPTEGSP